MAAVDAPVLGQWRVDYLPPVGGRLRGKLRLTANRLLFQAPVAPRQMARWVVGPLDACGVAYGLDLDPGQAAYDGVQLSLCLLRAQLASVAVEPDGLGRRVRVTVKDNGSTHLFLCGLRSAWGLADLIVRFDLG